MGQQRHGARVQLAAHDQVLQGHRKCEAVGGQVMAHLQGCGQWRPWVAAGAVSGLPKNTHPMLTRHKSFRTGRCVQRTCGAAGLAKFLRPIVWKLCEPGTPGL